jgi:predicted metalloprotease with PDZ domain
MQQTLHYTVDPFDLFGHRLRVTLHIPRLVSTEQVVFLPAWIPGSYLIRDFSRHVESIRGRSGKQWIKPTKLDDHSWVFKQCRSSLTIEIVIYAWDYSVRGAHVDDTHAFFNGTSVFLCPEGLEVNPCEVRVLRPANKPQWRAYTAMRHMGLDSNSNTLGRYQASNYDELIDHPFELGTPAVIEFEACAAKHQMVFTGIAPELDLARIARDTQRICEAQIRLFDPENQRAPFLDTAQRYVFMTLVSENGYGGLEHRASTALMASRKDLPVRSHAAASDGYRSFLGLLSHEYFHTWHVKRIKPAVFVPYELRKPAHTRLLWIFEGFTSYYDDLMLLRSGVIDLQAYLKLLAKTITAVHAGTGRFKQSVSESSFDAWTKYYKQDENAPNAISSYYAKGSLVALVLDLLIRFRSNQQRSLDDVMRLLWRRFGATFYTATSSTGLAEDAFADLVQQATGIDVRAALGDWVEETSDLPLTELLGQAGFELSWETPDEPYALGATFKVDGPYLVIRQVLQGGSAHEAGLSVADKILAINGLRVANSLEGLREALKPYRAGQTVSIHVFRSDMLRQMRLKLRPAQKSVANLRAL